MTSGAGSEVKQLKKVASVLQESQRALSRTNALTFADLVAISGAEAIEAIAHGDAKSSKVVGRAIEDIDLPEGTTIGAVVRGDKVILPCDEGRIRENDRVLLFCNKALVPKVEHLFRVSLEYF